MSTLNIRFINKWIAALRSGKYKQGRKRLRTRNGYCCLGVAMDLMPKYMGIKWVMSHRTYKAEYSYDGRLCQQSGILPDFVAKYIGLSNGHYSHLMDLNDCKKKDFCFIADEIEKMVK